MKPELFEQPGNPLVRRIVDATDMPQWVADQIPDDPPDWINWLIKASSLSNIYARAALAPPP